VSFGVFLGVFWVSFWVYLEAVLGVFRGSSGQFWTVLSGPATIIALLLCVSEEGEVTVPGKDIGGERRFGTVLAVLTIIAQNRPFPTLFRQ